MFTAADVHRGSPGGAPWHIPPLVRARAASGELPTGFRIGELEVAHLRGAEASCDVYLVTHVVDGSSHMARVARRSALAEQPELADAMLASARLLCGHRHPNLLGVLGYGWTDEASPRPYVLHERLVGRDLASYQARHGRIESSMLLAIGMQCAAGLDALHRLGLAHAGLRRSCVMLVPVGGDQFTIKLGGFEHARPIRPGATAGDEPRVAADLAALGVMLQELAAGMEDDEVSMELARVCADASATDPSQRPGSAVEVQTAIAEIRTRLDPAGSVAAFVDDVPQEVWENMFDAEATGRRGDRAPEFGQVSLSMRVERPVHLIRVTAGPWLMMWILLLGAAAVVMVAGPAGRAPGSALEAQTLRVEHDEPVFELDAPRFMPDLLPAPVSTVPEVQEVQEPIVAVREPVASAESPVRKRNAPTLPTLEVTVPVDETSAPTGRTEPSLEPMLPVRGRAGTAVPAAEPMPPVAEAAVPVEPAKPEASPTDDEDLLPVGGSNTRKAGEAAAEPFLVTSL